MHEPPCDTGLSGKDTEPTSQCPGGPLEGKLHTRSEVQGKVESSFKDREIRKIEFVTYHERVKLLYLPKIEHSDTVAAS